jgi:EmrB/QacA subfamily drug resistance transporter
MTEPIKSKPTKSEPASGDAAEASPSAPARLDHASIRAIMMGILLAMFLSALEQTIVAPALPTIGRTFGDVGNLSWVVTAYLLANTAMTPLFGKLSDIYGRRRMMLAAIAIFIVGSVACALAPTMPALIAARALQGIGGGGILPIAQTIIGDMVTPMERARYQSYTAIMFMIASVIGPVLGGVLTDHLHWTFIFWINLPIGLVALWMTDRVLRKLPRNDRPHRLDIAGALLMVLSALSLMLVMTWGGQRYGWTSPPILGLLAAATVLWLSFALRIASAPEPFIPLAVLREPVVAPVAIAGFFTVGTVIGLTIFLPVYFELVLGLTPSGSGTALIVFLAGTVTGATTAGRMMVRVVRYRRIPVAALVLGIVVLGVLAWEPGRLPLAAVGALLFGAGASLGVMYPMTTTLVQNAVAPHQLGIATGALNFARQLGGAFIVAAFGAIVLGGADTGGHGLTLETLRGGAGHAGADFAGVFGLLFAAGSAFLVAGLVAMLTVKEQPLRGPS